MKKLKLKVCNSILLASLFLTACNHGGQTTSPPQAQQINPGAGDVSDSRLELNLNPYETAWRYGLSSYVKSGVPTSPIFMPLRPLSAYHKSITSTNQTVNTNDSAQGSFASVVMNNKLYVANIDPTNNNSLRISEISSSSITENYDKAKTIITNGSNSNISHISMANVSGSLYVAYKNYAGNAAIKSYDSSANELRYVGSNGADLSNGESVKEIAITSGAYPVIAYIVNRPGGSQELRVKSYQFLTSTNQRNEWMPLHQGSLTSLIDSAVSPNIFRKSIKHLSVACDSGGNVFVAFNDDSSGPGTSSLNVLEYNNVLETWSFIGGGRASNQLNINNVNIPIISQNQGALETKLVIQTGNNSEQLLLAYVGSDSGKLSVTQYAFPTGNNTVGSWNYVGSLNTQMLADTNINSNGYVTGHNIISASGISLTVAPHEVSVHGPAKNLGNSSRKYLPYDTVAAINNPLNTIPASGLSFKGLKLGHNAILVSFVDNANGNHNPGVVVYDGNAWQYVKVKDEVINDNLLSSNIAIDDKTGYYFASYLGQNILENYFVPQSPFNKVIFATNTLYSGPNYSPANVYPGPDFSQQNYICQYDTNNPFTYGVGYVTNAASPYVPGSQFGVLIPSGDPTVANYFQPYTPLVAGSNYLNLDYKYVFDAKVNSLQSENDIQSLYHSVGVPRQNQSKNAVWSNSTIQSTTCNGFGLFSLSPNSANGLFGSIYQTNNQWINSFTTSCNLAVARLYCVTR